MRSAFLIVFTLLWSGFVLLFDGRMAWGIFKQIESDHYPSKTGMVTHSEVRVSHGSKGKINYTPIVDYRFELGGQEFTGSRLRYGVRFSDSGTARSIVDAHLTGATVQVYYNPDNPRDSLLLPGLAGSDFMVVLLLTPFNAIMLGFWIWVGGWLRERFFRPVAGGVKIIAGEMSTRVRLPRIGAMFWGVGATGGLGFISVFIVGVVMKMQLSIGSALAIIGAVYLAGAGVYFWQQRKIDSGIDDLVINKAARTLDLPLTFGRKERVTAKIADIESLTVEKIVHTSSKGGVSYTYAPMLGLRGADRQKLADWSDEMKANDFADWLRKELGIKLPPRVAG